MSWYTVDLKADAVIFSGGKFINGPQTTGIVLGRHQILDHCRAMASPNVRIGRPYKVGKEEYARFTVPAWIFWTWMRKQTIRN